jgi:hypothetical protein
LPIWTLSSAKTPPSRHPLESTAGKPTRFVKI